MSHPYNAEENILHVCAETDKIGQAVLLYHVSGNFEKATLKLHFFVKTPSKRAL